VKPLASDGRVLDFRHVSNLSEPLVERLETALPDSPGFELKERISATVRAARAQRELEIRQANDRAAAERLERQQKAKDALLSLLSDDVLNRIIGQHATLSELQVGTIKVTKHGVELIRSGGAPASQMSGEKLDINFNGAVPQSGQQLQSVEFHNRTQQLRVQGIEIVGVYDASGQSILITFDYGKALS
jgi:hypothetical protein